jgi:putative membrane protein
MKSLSTALALAVLSLPLSIPVQAQQGGVLTATKGEHAAFFVWQTSMTDMFEIEAAKIALQRTQTAGIRSFAEAMVSDHTRSKDQIAKAVKDNDLSTPLPERIDLKHQQVLDQLRRATDADFDHLYLSGQVAAHEEALKLYEHYAPTAEEASLRAIAEAGQPMVQHHLEQARSLQKSQ